VVDKEKTGFKNKRLLLRTKKQVTSVAGFHRLGFDSKFAFVCMFAVSNLEELG
jgi:hypothetical protein